MGQDASEPNLISGNFLAVREQIALAADRVGRAADTVKVVAVTKGLPREIVRKACALGLASIGENRVQEVVEKFGDGELNSEFPALSVHLIGHLQSNKARKAAAYCASVDSVDNLAIAEHLNRAAGEMGKLIRVLIEVNASGEPQKHGVSPGEAHELAESISNLGFLRLSGLMTVGPNIGDQKLIRACFRRLCTLFAEVQVKLNPPHWRVLSMGMSGDFELAIEEGATEIRLGTALFGARR